MGNNSKLTEQFIVRKAHASDIGGILDVASSVGSSEKVHSAGFLIDDYVKDYDYFKQKFTALIEELEHFYVIESRSIMGFLIAYKKGEWLRYNPDWIEDTMWSPEFNKSHLENFVLVDKTAILKGNTGKGLGSILYKTLINDIKSSGINEMLAETVISPTPNFASLEFRIKQNYKLAGVRYEQYGGRLLTDLVYHKEI